MGKSRSIKSRILETKHFGFVIGLIIFAIFLLLTYGIGFIQNLDRTLLDLNFNLKGYLLANMYGVKKDRVGVSTLKLHPKVSKDILLVGIDNQSLDTFGNWPFPRSVEANLVNTFTRISDQSQRERAVFLDINFIERDTKAPLNDAILIESIKANKRVFIEAFFHSVEFKKEISDNYIERAMAFFDKFGTIQHGQLKGDLSKLHDWKSVEAPLKPYIDASYGYGNVTTTPDSDEVFRRQALISRFSVPIQEIFLKDLSVHEKIDDTKFEYLAWTDKNGDSHQIPYPLTEKGILVLAKQMETSSPVKDVDTDNDGKIDASYHIVRKYSSYIVPTITLSIALEYFNRSLSDVEIVVGKYIKIKNPESYNKITNKWGPLVKKQALYSYPHVFDTTNFEMNILDKVKGDREKLRIISGYFEKNAVFDKYIFRKNFSEEELFDLQTVLLDIGFDKMELVRKAEAYDEISIPVDKQAAMLINFMGKPSTTSGNKTYNVYPFVRYARDPGPDPKLWKSSNYVENNIVVVGMFATGFADEKPTPYGLMFGPELITNSINTIIMDNFLVYAPAWLNIILLFLVVMLVSFIVSRFPTFASLGLSIFVVVFFFVFVQLMFDVYNYIVIFSAPSLSVVSVFIAIVTYRVMTEEKEKKKIKTMFGKYVSPQVVENLLINPPELGGVDKELTVFFSDIRGFTTLSETMTPQQLVNHLNEYLTAMTDIILGYTGTLDKYVGDEVMCFWGAPLPEPDHALLACKCALRQIEVLTELNKNWPVEKRINIGIGLNSGIMTVGNMGSPGRMNYTLMGDNVNLGARLEGTNKQYTTTIIISEYTYALVKDKVIVRELDNIRVKGKNKPVLIYELVDMTESYGMPVKPVTKK